jgi:hypothetical protein
MKTRPRVEHAQPSRTGTVAVGLRVKSGFAIAVVLRGPASAPVAVARRVVALSDPAAPETKQPYHHGFYTHEEETREIARRAKIVTRCAERSVAALVEEIGKERLRAALVVGSVIDPAKVGNPHIRAHACEGQLFRTVLEDALRSYGVTCQVIVEKQLAATATAGLGKRQGDIKRALEGYGKALGGPWRADEKAATTAAWLALQ